MIGDGLQADIPLTDIVAELTSAWDTYYILPEGASYAGDREVLELLARPARPERDRARRPGRRDARRSR